MSILGGNPFKDYNKNRMQRLNHLHDYKITEAKVSEGIKAGAFVWDEGDKITVVNITQVCQTCGVTLKSSVPFLEAYKFEEMMAFGGIEKAIENNEVRFISDFMQFPSKLARENREKREKESKGKYGI